MIRSAKILLLGDIAVGKTSIAKRLVFDRFDSDYKTTIGVNVLSHEVTVYDGGANKMRLVIWDTDGDFSQAIFNTTYVVGAAGAIEPRRFAERGAGDVHSPDQWRDRDGRKWFRTAYGGRSEVRRRGHSRHRDILG